MDFQKSKRFFLILTAAYWAFVCMIYVVAQEQFRFTHVLGDSLSAMGTIGDIHPGQTVTQRVITPAESITGVDLLGYVTQGPAVMEARLYNSSGEEVAMGTSDLSLLQAGQYFTLPVSQSAPVAQGESLTLVIRMQTGAMTIQYGNMISVGRFDIPQDISNEDCYTVDSYTGNGKLCIRLSGIRSLSFYKYYWALVGGVFLAFCIAYVLALRKAKRGVNSAMATAFSLFTRYRFLLKQLINRDFKTKYKRSVLGMCWSFLNPLLSMGVQYAVFSTLFRSGMPNYSVYLLIGIVFFNFFSEAVSMGMTSITGNAALIKKVYMPKYIYPISKLFSSLINLGLTMIPLILVMLLTGLTPKASLLLLVFDILCMMGFVLGMIFLLSTAMTFFQDTQFLWGVVSMMWMYLTPIFYPETIIPQNLLTLFHMNPMYQFITFARICIIDGNSPEPMAYLWCILCSVVVLSLGILVFRKHQNEFVLHL